MGLSQVTVYRYLHEVLEVIPSRAPSPQKVLADNDPAYETIG